MQQSKARSSVVPHETVIFHQKCTDKGLQQTSCMQKLDLCFLFFFFLLACSITLLVSVMCWFDIYRFPLKPSCHTLQPQPTPTSPVSLSRHNLWSIVYLHSSNSTCTIPTAASVCAICPDCLVWSLLDLIPFYKLHKLTALTFQSDNKVLFSDVVKSRDPNLLH